MKTLALVFVGLLVLTGCGNKDEKPAALSPQSIVGFWQYEGMIRPDGTRQAPRPNQLATEFTASQIRYLDAEAGSRTPRWLEYRSYRIQGAVLIDFETRLPTNQVTFDILQLDASKLRLRSRESRFVPAGTIFEYKRVTREAVDQIIADVRAGKR